MTWANVRSSTPQHETTESSEMSSWGPSWTSFSTVPTSYITDRQKALLRRAGYDFQDSARWIPYNVSVAKLSDSEEESGAWSGVSAGPGLYYWSDPNTKHTNATLKIVPAKCIYSYDYYAAEALAQWLAGYFNGTVHEAPSAVGVTVGGAPSTSGPAALLLNMYKSGNISFKSIEATFDNMTTSLTTYIRQNSAGVLTSPATGTVTHNETCVRIRWAWLTFPAALTVLMFVFFAAMVHHTSQTGTKVRSHNFKSNALPLVYHGLDASEPSDLSNRAWTTMSEIDGDAKVKYVALASTEKGWRFVEMYQGRKCG